VQVRLERLTEAIKRIYASTFSQHAKGYVRATPYRLEEEKMAVILQQVVGTISWRTVLSGFRWSGALPQFLSGAADGVGGRDCGGSVGDGARGGRRREVPVVLSAYPQSLIQFSAVKDILANSQSEFWALELNYLRHDDPMAELREVRFGLEAAETDGTLSA